MSRRLAVVVPLAVAAAAAAAVLVRHDQMVDLAVYRAAGWSVLHGLSPYRPGFGATVAHQALPFTYPPFAAAVFTALAAVPLVVARAVTAALAAGSLAWATVRLTSTYRPSPWLVALLAAGVVLLEPMREELTLGQVDAVLAVAVVADCLAWFPRVPRGVLTGVAAAVKITPAAFVVFFLAGRERRPAAVAAVSFAIATASAAVVAPRDAWRYWTSTAFDATRVGDLSYAANQSVRGALARLGIEGPAGAVLWITAAVAVATLAWFAAVRLRRRGDDLLALAVVATAALVAAPVAWTHHWVLAGPLLAVAIVRARPWAARAVVVSAVAVFAAGPQWWFAGRRDPSASWSIAQSLIGDAELWVALAFLVWAVWRVRQGNTIVPADVRTRRGPAVGARSGPPG